jgi:hypothetical protein
MGLRGPYPKGLRGPYPKVVSQRKHQPGSAVLPLPVYYQTDDRGFALGSLDCDQAGCL